eukprot:TRINITY_DN4471_c0_g1_i1.p1 TRINITY_DN4471_c0_g1~~TRINITY_DN4471_c0_g1_i1.p1  ORF type:complete len:946 (+),score=336.85 TRINITY_DN4471_c0_g1_i1:55-2892(+)
MEDEEERTTFHNVVFLGSRGIDRPVDVRAINDIIEDFNSKVDGDSVSLSIPKSCMGFVSQVSMEEAANQNEEEEEEGVETEKTRTCVDDGSQEKSHRFQVSKIRYFALGRKESSEGNNCFAFTHVLGKESFECRVYRCPYEDVVSKINILFAKAFQNTEAVPVPKSGAPDVELFKFDVNLEIQESSSESLSGGGFKAVPRHKNFLKLRANVVKRVLFTLKQCPENSNPFRLERCFGMLVSPGSKVRHEDMQLMEKIVMATSADGSVVISGTWDPRESAFASLNKETLPDESPVHMTVAADLVVSQMSEPIRFVFETRAFIYSASERFWLYALRSLHRQYAVRLKRKAASELYELIDIAISDEMVVKQPSSSLTLQLASSMASYVRFPGSTSEEPPPSPSGDLGDSSGDDEPLLSGFGEVSKDCTNSELTSWSGILTEWTSDRPPGKTLAVLVKKGIPEALRGEVWQRLMRTSELQDDIVETYKILNSQESPDEKIILRDIHRTFPAHEFFKKEGGVGQEALYRISKAYSVYDSEVGYCQGQSFLIAALLLQMPEEQAFGVLVKIMQDLGLRNIFRENFEELQCRLYTLDRLLEANLPDLWVHFNKVGLESHMYASQWFLTLFTAKFPLFLVFRVIDVFLYFGFESIFQVALGILKVSRKDMLTLDFEGLMKYFRVNIPKRYRSEDHAGYLMAVAMGIKLKKIKKYEAEWKALKEAERAREDPVVRYERENKRLLSDNLRLDTENDNLASQLLSSKVAMRKEIDALEDAKEELEKEFRLLRTRFEENNEDKKRLEVETESVKSLLKRELEKLESELDAKNRTIQSNELICSQLSAKLQAAQSNGEEEEEVVDPEGSSPESNRIRELELELARTKLALVETECKNQDLTHQISATLQDLNSNNVKAGGGSTWLSKTITTLRETTTAARNSNANNNNIKKSSSIDVIN